MKVYLITSGEYSDYHVDYAKLDREEAEKICAVKNKELRGDIFDIEEYDTDEIKADSDIEVKKSVYVERILWRSSYWRTDIHCFGYKQIRAAQQKWK